MDQQPPTESVDETLLTSIERVRSSRELLDELDHRIARSAELLDPTPPVVDLRSLEAAEDPETEAEAADRP